MAPEVLNGDAYSYQCDIYSVQLSFVVLVFDFNGSLNVKTVGNDSVANDHCRIAISEKNKQRYIDQTENDYYDNDKQRNMYDQMQKRKRMQRRRQRATKTSRTPPMHFK
jgi:hypothetical protein